MKKIKNLQDLNTAMCAIAANRRRVIERTMEFNHQYASLKTVFDNDCLPLELENEEHLKKVAAYLHLHRDDFDGSTVRLPGGGEIQWRKNPLSVSINDIEGAVKTLPIELLRQTMTIDKLALKQAYQAVDADVLLAIDQGYIEFKEEEVLLIKVEDMQWKV